MTRPLIAQFRDHRCAGSDLDAAGYSAGKADRACEGDDPAYLRGFERGQLETALMPFAGRIVDSDLMREIDEVVAMIRGVVGQ